MILALLAGCSPGGDDAAGGDVNTEDANTAVEDDWEGLELKFVSMYTTETSTYESIKHWMDRIEEETDGKIKTTFYGGDTLMKSTDQLPGVLDGIADVVLTDTSYNAEYWPLSRAYTLPGLIVDNSAVSTYAASEFIRTSDYPEFKQMKMLWALGLDTPGFMGNVPIEKLEDFKGLQVRCNSFSKGPIEAVGAAAVAIPAPEVYEALLKGTVDTNIMGYAALIDWRLDEVTKYEVFIPGITNTFHDDRNTLFSFRRCRVHMLCAFPAHVFREFHSRV
jgi:TRAP-type C4-dicarboxylate transport system substrate-binding protein